MTPSFISLALMFALGAVGVAMLLCGWRLVRGPTLPDRVLALDTLYVNVVAFVVLLGIQQGTGLYFEAALLIALLGFVSTVALGRYLQRGDVIE
jgi:multicomponent K+:H+ antiporter subunit F